MIGGRAPIGTTVALCVCHVVLDDFLELLLLRMLTGSTRDFYLFEPRIERLRLTFELLDMAVVATNVVWLSELSMF